jgi:xylulokinase
MKSNQLLLGYDIGTSSIKASLIEVQSGACPASAYAPKSEMAVLSPREGFAEQDPLAWWENLKLATAELKSKGANLSAVAAIGITYQMHGLVLADKNLKPLRPSIIWCDSRAVEIGNQAYRRLGEKACREQFLNSPGNFTASKLRWVLEFEPQLVSKAFKFMLPGDYIAACLTGQVCTTASGLSEMILWDYKKEGLADTLLSLYEIDPRLVPALVPTFGEQGRITAKVAAELGLSEGTPVCYRAGDQPNNAFSLKVLEPGEVAATAGTSGVVYGVGSEPSCDKDFRVNTFLHVNHAPQRARLGTLLCLNGCGILNSWVRRNVSSGLSYDQINAEAQGVPPGSEGLLVLPYGNGAERTLSNHNPGATFVGLDFNRHSRKHLFRAAQEGIAFALYYGLEIMRAMGVDSQTIRAGNANLFLSELFASAFASLSGAEIEIFDTDGAQGAARGAGLGAGIFKGSGEVFSGLKPVKTYKPRAAERAEYLEAYGRWSKVLDIQLNK